MRRDVGHEWSDFNIRIRFGGLILRMLELKDH